MSRLAILTTSEIVRGKKLQHLGELRADISHNTPRGVWEAVSVMAASAAKQVIVPVFVILKSQS